MTPPISAFAAGAPKAASRATPAPIVKSDSLREILRFISKFQSCLALLALLALITSVLHQFVDCVKVS